MVSDPNPTISFTASGRHELIDSLCEALCEVLAVEAPPEGAGTLVPWQASAASFEALPGRLIDAVLGELQASGGGLTTIEFSGYLETDEGPRAWGFLELSQGSVATGAVVHEQAEVIALESGYRITCRLRLETGDAQ